MVSAAAGLSILAFIFSYITTAPIGRFLKYKGMQAINYAGRKLPVGAGIGFCVSTLIAYTLLALIYPRLESRIAPLAAAMALSGLGGLIDDSAGSQDVKGIKGHIRQLLKGRFTAGAYKAISLLLAGLVMWSSVITEDPARGFLAVLIVPLCANTVNLTDLRPGRAGKAFFILISICFIGVSIQRNDALSLFAALALPAMGAVVGYLPHDLKGRVMMGDTGSNPLGVCIAALLVFTASYTWLLAVTLSLLALQIWAERGSLTSLINAHSYLRFIDSLGRSED